MGEASENIRVRVAVWLELAASDHHDAGLVVLRQNGRPFWVLPGGTLEYGETLEACARRELMEELGLKIEVVRLLSVSEFIQNGRHVLDVVVQGRWLHGQLPSQPPFEENIDAVTTVSPETHGGYEIQPKAVIEPLLRQWGQHQLESWVAGYIAHTPS
ncbi:MAG: NUDIX domain-containing protein [Vampirovibrionales bacterium]|nr:NUDIX domain-containing protein [Vampirovibrionales bacterium]